LQAKIVRGIYSLLNESCWVYKIIFVLNAHIFQFKLVRLAFLYRSGRLLSHTRSKEVIHVIPTDIKGQIEILILGRDHYTLVGLSMAHSSYRRQANGRR
jgi:hypothetical protein